MTRNLLETQRVATGTSFSAIPHDEHARHAVQQAISKTDAASVGSVLLFLSSAYAHAPQEAIRHAAKAAGTTQIFGCCALYVLSDAGASDEQEGAVAMVLPREFSITPLSLAEQLGLKPELLFTLTTPNTLDIAMNSAQIAQFGACSSDEFGHGPYSIWQSGQIVEQEYLHSAFSHELIATPILARGIRPLSPALQVNLADGNTITSINQSNAAKQLPEEQNVLCGVLENGAQTDSPSSLIDNTKKLLHVVASDDISVTLAGSVRSGSYIYWATRDEDYAATEFENKLKSANKGFTKDPMFALMFPNLSRGTDFYSGANNDLNSFKKCFPNTPLIGFYGNAEIAPDPHAKHSENTISTQHSAVCCLFHERR